jgi:3-hydroxy-9,10-secoandrosta-1,3,5(10)-triene-9,17-dione monooxygenase reductase component
MSTSIVEHIEYRASDHDAFVVAFTTVKSLLLGTRGCRRIDVTRSKDGDVYHARIEWRSSADRDALDAAPIESALASFERRSLGVETPIDLDGQESPHDATALRQAFGQFPSGVGLVTAAGPNGPAAMLVSSFTSVSLKPTLVSFCAAHTSTTWPIIADAKSCAINLLAASQAAIVKQLSSKKENRFEGIAWSPAPSGAPVLDGVVGWLDCTIAEVRVAGDHDLVLLNVRAIKADPAIEPLVFHRSAFRVLSP